MDVLAYTLGVLMFVVGVAVSIGLHELGHLLPGKLYDVKVTQYFVGFGRTLWSRRKGETEYGVKAVPLGGYVKLVGMLPPAPNQDPAKVRSSNTGMFSQLMSDARSAEYELVEEGDEDRLFYKLPWYKRIVIMGSGVTINLVLAFVLFAIVFMGHGVPEATTKVEAVSQCVVAVTEQNKDTPRGCTAADPEAPAKIAGIKPGDTIVGFNGRRIEDWSQLEDAIRGNANGEATIVVDRAGRELTLHTNTTVSPRVDPSNPERISKVGFLGVYPHQEYVRQGPGYVVTTMATGTWDTVKALGAMPVKLYHVGRAALGLEQRDVNGPMSVVGAGRVAGELASANQATFAERFFSVLLLIAGLNLFLAMFNLVPLPPLDGGPIAATLYEAARRGIARLRHKPDPGFVDSAKLLPVTYVMATVILLASLVLIYADIVAPVSLG
ncbi:MAG: PDZ domain-containing protein [Nocardioidaceae bacterium]|nr:PDZ domain-containing protein [Nocardioidaceae bacterium]NUS51354.1 PDZ domain-containing protein [Nocardioidaceae bacterium]